MNENETMSGVERWTKKPITVNVMMLTDTNAGAVTKWIRDNGGAAVMRGGDRGGSAGASISVQTLEGIEVGTPGYVFIQGVRGEFYPCEGSIFAETYDPEEVPLASDERNTCPGCGEQRFFNRSASSWHHKSTDSILCAAEGVSA